MNVRCLVSNCLQQDQVQQFFYRIGLGQLLQLIQVDTLVPAVKFNEKRIALYLIYQLVDIFVLLCLIVFSQGLFECFGVGYLRCDLEAHQSAQIVSSPKIFGIVKGNNQFIQPLIVFDWDDVVRLCHLRRYFLDYIGRNIDTIQTHILHSALGRQGYL